MRKGYGRYGDEERGGDGTLGQVKLMKMSMAMKGEKGAPVRGGMPDSAYRL